LVGCCVVVRRPLPSGLFCLFRKTGGGLFEVIRCVPFPDAFEARDIGWTARARAPDRVRRRRHRRRLCSRCVNGCVTSASAPVVHVLPGQGRRRRASCGGEAAAAAAAAAPQFVGWLLRCRCILKVI
jgi:hypothetical protein